MSQRIPPQNPLALAMGRFSITRSTGISIAALGLPWAGPLPGGGYQGATATLDRAVVHHARALKAWLGRGVRIEIRFNADRKSGGAWVWDRHGSDTIGFNAGLGSRRRISRAIYLDRTLLKPGVMPRNDKGGNAYAYVSVRDTADGIRTLQRLIDPEKLTQYLRSVRRPKATRTGR